MTMIRPSAPIDLRPQHVRTIIVRDVGCNGRNRVVRLMFHCLSDIETNEGAYDSMILTRKNSLEYVEGEEYYAGDVCVTFINCRLYVCTHSIK